MRHSIEKSFISLDISIYYEDMNNEIDREIRFTAMWCSLASLIMPVSLVFDGTFSLLMAFFISPILVMLIWITNRKKHPFIDKSAKKALNFTLSIDLCLAIAAFCQMRSILWWTELYYSLSPEDFIANYPSKFISHNQVRSPRLLISFNKIF